MPDMKLSSVSELLEQSIDLENNIGQLYYIFSTYYEKDKIFWAKLSKEEQKHANILEGLRPWAALKGDIEQYLLSNLNELRAKNAAIRKVINFAKHKHPTREEAFNAAYKIELTASELHYQKIITKETDNKLLNSMQELCGADKDHLKRIKKMMDSLGIEVIKE